MRRSRRDHRARLSPAPWSLDGTPWAAPCGHGA